ncbi:ketopantoate reductase PanE/ApbA-domain-containing protein [Colletotrichum phormii]|uniref:Ketopantoate reductase PanE/ApbA-domain-containing protein n=1 Tax=Colletotrichum phormii TaxID=359342 RepID=A0AAJ0A3X1_9PEZI|nr:ketopantoate reductase PanE/ApbA-domain-containing protein [Colletotrichum phormii]KAK1656015.1 ketopantoate reductase PanE/ApbA-domain-containing protein [Colletotrichum phormii]
MAPMTPRLKILSVGGNPVSAFLSWRLQATNACDVTLVWKSGFDHVAQYGISFKSPIFGNERFKPRHVVRVPEEAAHGGGPFDYVILCIKALPDVYDLAAVIDAVVTPQHTCILVNTTHTLGVEAAIEERFPTNVVLSLVSNAELSQLGQSEFEHKGSTEIWVGPSCKNENIPGAIQGDMAEALAMTLNTAQVDCKVSQNIRQQQYERVIGPIAFHPASVIFETASHAQLLEKVGVKDMVTGVIDELLALADAHGCKLSPDFKQKTIDEMTKPTNPESIMWQDYIAKRPMEVETYLGSPIKLAKEARVPVPRIESLYAILHNLNIVNRQKPPKPIDVTMAPPGSPTSQSPLPRMSSSNGARPMMNGNGMPPNRGPRPRNSSNLGPGPPPGMRRPPMNGGPPNGFPRGPPPPGSRAASRRGSMEGNDLEEFSHLMMYDDIPEGGEPGYSHGPEGSELAIREREMELRQRELALREREMRMRSRGPPPRRGPHPMRNSAQVFDEEDDDDDYFDPNSGPPAPMIDPDNFDMMSVTSRKNRKAAAAAPPSRAQYHKNEIYDAGGAPPARSSRFRPNFGRNRSSQIASIPAANENILDDPLFSYSSNRYGAVDRGTMQAGSRANSLTASRLDEMHMGGGPMAMGMNGAFPRRASQSPGNPYSPSIRGGSGRPSPPNGYHGPPMNGRPSPPDGMRQPVPRYPPGHGNAVAPQQVEQHIGVSGLVPPPKQKNMRSLTGSASASAGSGESQNDTEPSAHSSQSSLGPRPAIGVR